MQPRNHHRVPPPPARRGKGEEGPCGRPRAALRASQKPPLNMRLIIHNTPDGVAHYIARYIQQRIIAYKPTPERPFVLGLPTGSSPITV